MPKTIHSLRKTSAKIWKKVLSALDKRPMLSFFGMLALLLVLIVIGNRLRQTPEAAKQTAPEPELVETYSFGQSPKLTLSATIEKAGVIQVIAQTAGVVQRINTTEGKHVSRGSSLVSLSSTAGGANAATLSRELAEKNATFTRENFDTQLDLIHRQRDLATKNETLSKEQREITRQSLDDTRNLIALNDDIISSLDTQIKTLESTNVGGANDSAILGAKQGKAAAAGGLNQLKSTLKSLEYQSDESKIPAGLATANRDLTLKQLDLQEKSLTLSKEVSDLNLKLARVAESLMYPATPCSGTVERIYVNVGQSVAPGTLIATLTADKGEITALVRTSGEIARQLSKTDESTFVIGGKKVGLLPRYISKEATDGNLYSVLYSIPAEFGKNLTNTDTIPVQVALGSTKIVMDELFVPLDSMYQTQEKAYVYIAQRTANGEQRIASVKEVVLGEVVGSMVRVKSGLSANDVVILSRDVQENDLIRTE